MGGPRAERPELASEYEAELPEFALRLQAKAGLTGYEAAGAIKAAQESHGRMVACLEEIALENGWISREQVLETAERMKQTAYGTYLRKVVEGNAF